MKARMTTNTDPTRPQASSRTFPTHRWGRVTSPGVVSAVRIDVAVGGFLFITVEPHGTFDVWLEAENDVVDALGTFTVTWDPVELAAT